MSLRSNGSYIGYNRVTTTSQDSASGIWSLAAAERRRRAAAWPPSSLDQYFANVSLLLHMDGTNGSTTFTDSSSSPHSITASGNASVSTAQSQFGGGSAYFDGSGDFLSVPAGSEFDFGTGDFCIEVWFRPGDMTATRAILGKWLAWASNLDFMLWYSADGSVAFGAGDNAPMVIASSAGVVSVNTWNHVAVARASGTTRLYVNGSSVGTPHTGSVNIPNDKTTLIVGGGDGTSFPYLGYIDDLRITKGTARGYTGSTITVPTDAFPDA